MKIYYFQDMYFTNKTDIDHIKIVFNFSQFSALYWFPVRTFTGGSKVLFLGHPNYSTYLINCNSSNLPTFRVDLHVVIHCPSYFKKCPWQWDNTSHILLFLQHHDFVCFWCCIWHHMISQYDIAWCHSWHIFVTMLLCFLSICFHN